MATTRRGEGERVAWSRRRRNTRKHSNGPNVTRIITVQSRRCFRAIAVFGLSLLPMLIAEAFSQTKYRHQRDVVRNSNRTTNIGNG
jgi:hypothetical protein